MIALDLDRRERITWASAIALFAVGDLATTVVGLQVPGVIETSATATTTIASIGLAGLVPHKIGAIALFATLFVLARLLSRPTALGVPLGLALLGAILTAHNATVIASAI